MTFDVDAISLADLRRRRSAKYQAYAADVLPAWVAEMDFPLAEPIARELHDAITRSDTGYPWRGDLPEVFAEFARTTWSWDVNPDRISLVPDVIVGVEQAIWAMTEPGDGVVINPPVYHPFFSIIADICGRTLVEVPMVQQDDGGYYWDVDGLAAAFARPDVTAFLLCNPHNPTGSVAPRQTLEAIVGLAAANGVAVISDEIHAPMTLGGAIHVPLLTVAEDDARAMVVTSSSKSWNTPGLKCAQVVPTRAADRLLRASMPLEVTYGTGSLGVVAATAAYAEGGEWLAHVRGILDDNRRRLVGLLAEAVPAARYRPPDASYLAWIDMRACGLGDDPAARLLDRGRVALSSGPTFGTPGLGFARLNFATSPTILEDAVSRIARACDAV